MVLDKAYPPDLRVENEASTLVEAGYDVSLLAIGPDDRARRTTERGVRVTRDRIPAFLRNKMRGLSGSVPLLDLYLGRRIRALHAEDTIDAIHAHDLYLFGACIRAGRRLGIPVVGDMHENWVEALRHYRWSTHFPGRLVINFERWARLERTWSLGVDGLVVVIEEMQDRLEKAGIRPSRIAVVPNTVKLDTYDDWPIQRDIVTAHKNDFTIVYTGGMDQHRGLTTAIDAMPAVREAIPNARLLLVGDGSLRSELMNRAASVERITSSGEGASKKPCIEFTGWQPQELVASYIAAADVGLIPHSKTVHTDNTIPHKLFHYMYAGKPVVATNCAPIERIVEDEGAGLIFRSDDASELSDALIRLGQDANERRGMGERGFSAVSSRLNWDHTAQRLVDLYRDIIS